MYDWVHEKWNYVIFFFFGAKVNGFDCWHLADMYNNNWLGYGT